MGDFQPYQPLDDATEAALRHSIRRFGVMQPAVVSRGPWRPGCIIDGNHRSRIARELGLSCPNSVRTVRTEDEAEEIARTLNEDRRHLPPEQRREYVVELRREGHSERAIARALGVSQPTVHRDIEKATDSGESVQPDAVRSLDGKERPASQPSRPPKDPEPSPAPTTRGRREVDDVLQHSDEERLRINFTAAYERFSRVLHELLDLSPERVAAILNDADGEALWQVMGSTRQRDLPAIDAWFEALAKARPKPFSVVQGGLG